MKLPNNLDSRILSATHEFWTTRRAAISAQKRRGGEDRGERAAVTGGKNLDGFRSLIEETLRSNGVAAADIHRNRKLVALPGYFRPAKLWDLVAVREGRLILALELKSLGGPSFGNNSNNRCEEAIGSGYDFRRAQNFGAFGSGYNPFLGYFILVEDAIGSRKPVEITSPHFPSDPVFQNGLYQTRMRVLCERLMDQQLYDSAAVLTTIRPVEKRQVPHCESLSESTSFKRLLARMAAHVAAESA